MRSKNALALAVLLALGGCASPSCDTPWSDSPCREQHLLYQNDLIQAKILISAADEEGYELAHALLKRAESHDELGEVDFYRAVLMIREGPQPHDVIAQLERAANKGHPHAIALLYRIYDEPYLLPTRDPERAARYRDAYAALDVAQSGYPSFDKAVEVVGLLIEPPPRGEEARAQAALDGS
ncbi:hypothetical protein [Stutzerimonas azotifigens]|uniref:hypothetical protein n=1 Tax=Stutzerimonas azotifigens TaxID=291995 RepID=UPI0004055B2F|nr:hypothetical protein [Stutzerimonas azotifigens]